MECWLIYNELDVLKNKEYINIYFEQCKKRNIKIKLLIAEKIFFCIMENEIAILYENKRVGLPYFVINRTRNYKIAQFFEMANIKVFNNSEVTNICNDKMLTFFKISSLGIDMCNTALNSKISDFPFILKSIDGHGGIEVFKIENEIDFIEKSKKLEKRYITQCISNNVGKDLRVYVIGKKIIAAMLRKSKNDFRSNFSLGGTAEIYTLSKNEIDIIEKIVNIFDFSMVGIDFIFHNDRIYFNEIEDVVGARMLYKNTNIDIVELYFEYIEEVL